MMYKIFLNQDGVPAGYVSDESGEYTKQQAEDALLCGKLNPSADDVSAATLKNERESASVEYKRNRVTEYPPITDYLDAVVKGDQAQIDKYIADCQAVKAKYPKP